MRSHLQFVFAFASISCLWHTIDGRTSESLRVTLPSDSKIVGRYLTSHDGKGIRAFMGVPYAEPPVGPLRFKAPVPKRPWQGELETIADPHKCTQRDPYRRSFDTVGSEDCLYLNVYTPTEDRLKDKKKPLSVMVFFHGGGFMCGSGIREYYGPEFLLDHDIIYIGANYRPGPLGFLSTGQEDCPGNFGLKDQVQVLRWVQENIATFGGDPKSVTIFGESAGGASVTYLMMTPLAKGLFSKAISESGTNLDPWALPAHIGVAPKRATILAGKFGCQIKAGWAKTIECLRKVPAENITAAFYDFFEWDTDPMVPFPPVVEPDLPGAYLTEHPRDVVEPHGLSIPFLTGVTSDEGSLKSASLINVPELHENFRINRDRAMPIALYYDHHSPSIQEEVTRLINKYYFNNEEFSSNTHQNLTNLFGDAWFLSGMDLYLQLRLLNAPQSGHKVGPTYTYLLSHKSAASYTETFVGGRENYYGTTHAEELQYLFPVGTHLFVSSIPSEDDEQLRKIMTELWVNFANTGNPTPATSSLPKWLPSNGFPFDYYRIGNVDRSDNALVGMDVGIMDERAQFWRDLDVFSPHRSKTGNKP